MMKLDVPTLTFAVGVMFFLLTFLFFLMTYRKNPYPGVRLWGWGGVAIAGGFSLLFLRWMFPETGWVILIDNALLFAGAILVFAGSKKFFGRDSNWKWLISINVLVYFILHFFLFVDDQINFRIFLFSTNMFVLMFFTAHVFFTESSVPYKRATRITGWAFLITALFNLARAVYAISFKPYTNLYQQDDVQMLTFIVALMLGLFWMLSLINIINQRLNLELKHATNELKKTTDELTKANMDKYKLFSIISHDIKSNISSINGMSGLLTDKLLSLSDQEKDMISDGIRKQSMAVFELLGNIMEWSKTNQGVIPCEPVDRYFKDLMAPEWPSLYELMSVKKQQFQNDIPDDLIVRADPFMFQTIMRNLLNNAIKFTPQNGSIGLSLCTDLDGQVCFCISDTGIGMSQKMVETLFNVDVKNNRAGTENEPSSGLGLILTKEFIEKHGGRIWVESAEGKGTTFHFTLTGSTSREPATTATASSVAIHPQ